MVCFELLHAWGPPKRRFDSSWNSLYFPEIFSQRTLRIHAIRRGNGKYFTAKVCSLHLLQMRGLTKVFEWNNFHKRRCCSKMFAWSVFYPTEGKKINILGNGSIRCGLQDLLDFTLKTAALKYNNNNNNRLLILQAWPVKLCKKQKKATYFKNSPWPKYTEKTDRGAVAN